jgi:hypothetical protein
LCFDSQKNIQLKRSGFECPFNQLSRLNVVDS